MEIDLAFGRTGLGVSLPEAARPVVIRKPPIALPDDPALAISTALDAPIGSAPLKQLAQGAGARSVRSYVRRM